LPVFGRSPCQDESGPRAAAISVLLELGGDHATREDAIAALAQLRAQAIETLEPGSPTAAACANRRGRGAEPDAHPQASTGAGARAGRRRPRVRWRRSMPSGGSARAAAAQRIAAMRDYDHDPAVRLRAAAVCQRHSGATGGGR
jgi:hypothetical protein